MHIEDTAYAKKVIDVCKEFMPDITIKLDVLEKTYNNAIVAQNLNNNKIEEKEIYKYISIGESIYTFLESLMEKNKFWENTKPVLADIDNHSIFVNQATDKKVMDALKMIVKNRGNIVDGLSRALCNLANGCRGGTVKWSIDSIELFEIEE